jgi:hypothetical protein
MSKGEAGQMTGYEIVFAEAGAPPQPVPEPGETVQIGEALWTVQGVEETTAGRPRLRLVAQSDADQPEVEAHRRRTIAVHPPSSFETELVYTLNDLSTRLNVLAATLNAYWGKGAA